LDEQEKEKEKLNDNTFVEELFQDSLEESTSENLQYRDTEDEHTVQGKNCSKDNRSLCESIVDDLLSKIMDTKDCLREGESSPSKSFNPPRNHVKYKLSRQDADDSTEGLLMGKVGCQGCGTEQVHECEDEGEGMMTTEEKVEKADMTELIGKLRAMDTQGDDNVDKTLAKVGEEEVEDAVVLDAEPAREQEFNPVNEAAGQECVGQEYVRNRSDECKQVTLDIIEEILDEVIEDQRKEEKSLMSKEERVKRYLEFVRLWSSTKPGEESEKRREANLVWRHKIEDGLSMSEVNYLEQVAILRATRRQQQFGDAKAEVESDDGVEFTCYGAEESVQVAGSFNDWEPEELEQKEDGEWVATLKIDHGTHLYKYVVDGEWLVDPSKEMVTDSKGNTNNVVVVEDRLGKCKRQIQKEREQLMEVVEAAWSPSGLGLNLCPVSIKSSKTSMTKSATS